MFKVHALIPEIFQFAVIMVLFIQSLGSRDWKPQVEKWLPVAAGLGVAVAVASIGVRGEYFYAAYKVDGLSQFFKLAVAGGFFVTVLNASRQPTLEEGKRTDYFMFMAFSAWGLMLLASSVELITIYLALEVSSYSLYALIPLRAKDKQAAEAGVKYILFGAAATALALYGLSYVIAGQHTTYLSELMHKSWAFKDAPMAVVGLSLFLAGFFFKLALFPFHFWAPDVYQGTSNETAAYAATLPKLGAAVVLIRLCAFLKPELEITMILAVLGAASMTFANLAALAQKDVKRILGYSSVSHAGYIMVGLVACSAQGLGAAAFYSMAYVFMNLACFWVLCRASGDGRNLSLDDLNGLHRRAPVLAFVLAVGAFALVGLPPMAGFMGKFFLLSAAWDHGYNWLVIVAAVNTAVSIYYYLSMVRHAYTADEVIEDPAVPDTSHFSWFWGVAVAAVVLLMGVAPSPLFKAGLAAGESLLR